MTLIISGIHVEICRKDIKNMLLYVKPPDGRVTVSAPLSTSREEIEYFVHTKTKWIKKQIEKFENHTRQYKPKYDTGETMLVWGDKYTLKLEYGTKKSIVISGKKIILTIRKESTTDQKEKYVREWYRELTKEEIEKELPKWEKKTGLKAESWQVKYMISRWGSCKPKKRNICLSLLLAKKNPECLNYVILHELLHFLERGHNERFYNLMYKYMPDWKEIRKELNTIE